MTITQAPVLPEPSEAEPFPPPLREQYGCGPIQFTGSDTALYERHLLFDNVVRLATPARASGSRRSPTPCATPSPSDGS